MRCRIWPLVWKTKVVVKISSLYSLRAPTAAPPCTPFTLDSRIPPTHTPDRVTPRVCVPFALDGAFTGTGKTPRVLTPNALGGDPTGPGRTPEPSHPTHSAGLPPDRVAPPSPHAQHTRRGSHRTGSHPRVLTPNALGGAPTRPYPHHRTYNPNSHPHSNRGFAGARRASEAHVERRHSGLEPKLPAHFVEHQQSGDLTNAALDRQQPNQVVVQLRKNLRNTALVPVCVCVWGGGGGGGGGAVMLPQTRSGAATRRHEAAPEAAPLSRRHEAAPEAAPEAAHSRGATKRHPKRHSRATMTYMKSATRPAGVSFGMSAMNLI